MAEAEVGTFAAAHAGTRSELMALAGTAGHATSGMARSLSLSDLLGLAWRKRVAECLQQRRPAVGAPQAHHQRAAWQQLVAQATATPTTLGFVEAPADGQVGLAGLLMGGDGRAWSSRVGTWLHAWAKEGLVCEYVAPGARGRDRLAGIQLVEVTEALLYVAEWKAQRAWVARGLSRAERPASEAQVVELLRLSGLLGERMWPIGTVEACGKRLLEQNAAVVQRN